MEIFAKPAVGAIIEKTNKGKRYILIQERHKEDGGFENGMIEFPAGKVREYENILDTLCREVYEETGLRITSIRGEENMVSDTTNGYETISILPFLITQNLSGGYSIVLQTFICHAEGELLIKTNETTNIRWEEIEIVEMMIIENPQLFYPLHINSLKKYFFEYLK